MTESKPTSREKRRFVLITGAAGRIGSGFRREMGNRYRLRLADLHLNGLEDTPGASLEVINLDVAEAVACKAACIGIDTVLHLAADPSPAAKWEESLLPNNIQGTVNIVRAAHAAGCRRIIFASSVHAVAGYPWQPSIADDAAPRPVNLYGASKAFGEAVLSTYAANGLSGIAIRIGAYDAPWFHEHGTARDATAYVSERDLNDLIVRCIETERIEYAIVAGVSNNQPNRFDLSLTRRLLGYVPQDDGFQVLSRRSTGER